MFLTNVVLGNQILDRQIFWSLTEATYYANQKAKEKIWRLADDTVFFGDVEVRVYKPNLCKPSDFKDEHIFSFTHSR
jgi:hypothetical protein